MLLPVTSLQEDEEPARKESPGPVVAPQSPTFSEELGFERNIAEHRHSAEKCREHNVRWFQFKMVGSFWVTFKPPSESPFKPPSESERPRIEMFYKSLCRIMFCNLRTTCIQVLARLSSESGPVPSSLIHVHASSVILFHPQHQRRSKISIAGKPAPCILNA